MTPYEHEIDELLTQAEALLQDEKAKEALDLLDRARTLEPHHAWTMLFRGVALGQLDREDEAAVQLVAAADASPDDIDIQVDAARHLTRFDQYQDALVFANRAVILDDTDAGAHAARAEALEHLGRIGEAVPDRETALAFDPIDWDSRYYLAVDLCDLGRYQEADEIAQALFAEFPDDPDIIRLHGACLSYLGRHQDALALWAELERLEGMTPNLLHNRASTLDALGRYQEALATINDAIAEEPDQGMNYYTRGMIREHHGDDHAAIDDYLAALAFGPDHLDTVINLVELAAATDATASVLEQVLALLDDNPTSAQLLYARGRLDIDQGNFTEGLQAIEDAVRREPSLAVGWYTLSMLYGMAGEYESAIVTADRALRDFPDDAGLWVNRGAALHELKRYPEAMESYDKAIEFAPDEALSWLHLGRLLLLDLDRPSAACGALKEALRLQPSESNARWMLALCYLRLARYDDCARETATILARDPDHLWGRLVRAAQHAQQGNLDVALADLEIVIGHDYDPRLLFNEPLFAPLVTDPRFDSLIQRYVPGVEDQGGSGQARS